MKDIKSNEKKKSREKEKRPDKRRITRRQWKHLRNEKANE